jgi:hypothetical protein
VTRLVAAVLVALLVTLTSGCELGEDDEMAPKPTRTVTRSPAPEVPASVPTGEGDVSPSSVVWAQESTLHFGTSRVDVAPLRIDSFVVVPGGVFFVSRSELWFTDLSRVRATGLMGVTRVSTTRDADALRVDLATGSDAVVAYDLGTGESNPPAQVVPATDADLRGTAKRVVLPPGGAVEARRGPGDYGLVGGDGGQLVAYEAATRKRVSLKGVVGSGFKLVRWQDGNRFFGVALGEDGNPLAVMSCNLSKRSCTKLGEPDPDRSLVFESAA